MTDQRRPKTSLDFHSEGLEHIARGRLRQALLSFDRASRLDSTVTSSLLRAAELHGQLGELEAACSAYREAAARLDHQGHSEKVLAIQALIGKLTTVRLDRAILTGS